MVWVFPAPAWCGHLRVLHGMGEAHGAHAGYVKPTDIKRLRDAAGDRSALTSSVFGM